MSLFTQTRIDFLNHHPSRLHDYENERLAQWLKTRPNDYTNLIEGLDNSNSHAEAAAIYIYADYLRRLKTEHLESEVA